MTALSPSIDIPGSDLAKSGVAEDRAARISEHVYTIGPGRFSGRPESGGPILAVGDHAVSGATAHRRNRQRKVPRGIAPISPDRSLPHRDRHGSISMISIPADSDNNSIK
ncbi:hypothetical protein ACL03H_18635 [Saccharopolyspora sp. MS10]|uniref:hypothetical protein n=1 Tax=Saccharopolyspora sp. MS10 TaxID=3385973 RepID=UPI0039A091DC